MAVEAGRTALRDAARRGADGGDAAAALVFGPGTAQSPVLAEIVAHASATDEFLDRWRVPGQAYSRTCSATHSRIRLTSWLPVGAGIAAGLPFV